MLIEVEHPQLGKMRHVGTPLRLKGTPAAQATAAPLAGEDTEVMLGKAGYTATEIVMLREQGVIL